MLTDPSDNSRKIAVSLTLGGVSYRFLLNTTSTCSLIMVSMAPKLPATDLNMNALGPGLQPGMRVVRVDEAALGALECGPLDLVATPETLPIPYGTAGILGLNFLSLFDWHLDIGAACCNVSKPQQLGVEAHVPPFDLQGMREVPLSRAASAVLTAAVELRAGQRKAGAIAVIDMGSARTLCNMAAASALQLEPSELRDNGVVLRTFGGADVIVKEAALTLAIGDGKDGPITVEVLAEFGDASSFASMGLTSCGPVVLLGLDALGKSSRLALSARTGRLWLPADAL